MSIALDNSVVSFSLNLWDAAFGSLVVFLFLFLLDLILDVVEIFVIHIGVKIVSGFIPEYLSGSLHACLLFAPLFFLLAVGPPT